MSYKPTMFCLPQYAGWAIGAHTRSLIEMTRDLSSAGYPFGMNFGEDSAVHRNRYFLAQVFWEMPEWDRCMWIDADIGFKTEDVMRLQDVMTETVSGIVTAPYRMKRDGAKLAAWKDGKLLDMDDLPNEPFDVDYAGTGFMLVSRGAMASIHDALPTLETDRGETKQWFSFEVEKNIELSEDYNFCRKVRNAGHRVMMCPDIELKHYGLKGY